jgi:hypothetical protein
MQINQGGLYGAMAQKALDHVYVDALFEQMGGKAMPLMPSSA